MAAVTAALLSLAQGRRPRRGGAALFGSCRYVIEDLLPRFGITSTLVDGTDLDAVEEGGAAEHQGVLPGKPDQSDARDHRHRGGRRDRAQGRRAAGRRQRVRDAALPEPAGRSAPTSSSIPRPSTSTARAAARRRHPRRRELHHDNLHISCGRPGRRCRPFNAWVLLKGLETLPVRVRAADRERRRSSPSAWPSTRRSRRVIYPGRADHPQARHRRRSR